MRWWHDLPHAEMGLEPSTPCALHSMLWPLQGSSENVVNEI